MKNQTIQLRTTLNSLSRSLEYRYVQLKNDLNKWHRNMIECIQNMYLNTLIELDTSYERLDTFRQTLYVLLHDEQLADKTGLFKLEKYTHMFCLISSSTYSII